MQQSALPEGPSPDLLRRLVDRLPAFVAYVDARERFVFANAAYARHFGVQPRELVGRPVSAVLGDDYGKVRDRLERALGGEPQVFEITLGEQGPRAARVEVSYSPDRQADGTIAGCLELIRVVRGHAGGRAAAAARGSFAARVLDQLFSFVAILDLDGTLREANRAPLVAAGLAIGEVRGRKFWDCYWWNYDRRIQTEVRDACERAARGETVSYDVVVRMAGDSRMPIAFQVAPLIDGASGASTHLVASAVDVSEREQARRELARTSGLLQGVTDTLPDPVFAKDRAGRMLMGNRATFEIIGQPETRVLGRRESQWHQAQPEQAAAIEANDRQVMESGSPMDFEEWLTTPDGPRLYATRKAPLRDEGGRVIGLVGVARDVTDERELERRLRESYRRKDEFLAVLGHELRNPLAAIRHAVRLLGTDEAATEKRQQPHAVLERQARHMDVMVQSLLEAARLSRGKLELDRSSLDLREVVDAVGRAFDPGARERGVELRLDVPATPVWVFGDEVRLAQVIDNLLGNALKFTAARGRITIALEESAGEVRLSVRDTGAGITPEALETLFEPFEQDRSDVGRGGEGLGLGLSIVRGLVELHGGTVTALSEGPGRGAVFTVRLDAAEPPEHLPARPERPADRSRRSCRIYLIEDNVDAAAMLSNLLELAGHDVVTFERARPALDAMREQPPDVVLCDLGLPGMDGHALAEAVRRDAGLGELPLIALTGFGQRADRERALAAGFDHYLVKPVEFEVLQELLGEL